MIDFNKITSQLNIKDLDVAKLTRMFNEHQNFIIKTVLIIGSLLIAMGMFNDHHVKDRDLRSQISDAQEKLDAIKAREAAVDDLKEFKSSLPSKISQFELIALVSNYAKANNVTITSLVPPESSDMGLYDVINFNFNAGCDSFKSMMLFLRNIEGSQFPLRIDSWSGHEDNNGQISFILKMSAVVIHR